MSGFFKLNTRRTVAAAAAARLRTAPCWTTAETFITRTCFSVCRGFFCLFVCARAPTPPFTHHDPTVVFRVSSPLARFHWWLLCSGDGHHPAGASGTTMPGEALRQGPGMEEEGVVDQQQAECGQVRCWFVR